MTSMLAGFRGMAVLGTGTSNPADNAAAGELVAWTRYQMRIVVAPAGATLAAREWRSARARGPLAFQEGAGIGPARLRHAGGLMPTSPLNVTAATALGANPVPGGSTFRVWAALA